MSKETIGGSWRGCRGVDDSYFTFGLDRGGVKVFLYPPK